MPDLQYAFLKKNHRPREQGATLIAGLIFLLLLTVAGMAVMDVTSIDTKIMANSKDRQLAFNSADARLFEAGDQISASAGALQTGASRYLADTYADAPDWWSDDSKWEAVVHPQDSDYVIEQPRQYKGIASNGVTNLTQDNTNVGSIYYEYPVKAKSMGPGGAEVMLSAQYLKKLENNVSQ